MTKTEAINIMLQMIKDEEEFLSDDTVEAHKMAIQALSQEPCEDWYDVPSDEMTLKQARQAVKDLRKKLADYLEQEPCDDVVSRDAALEKMADYVASGYADSAEDFLGYSRIICQLPSVTQKHIECEDAISRQAVLSEKIYTETEGWSGYTVDADYIEHLPSVTQKSETVTEFADRCRECGATYGKLLKQKTGHWIYDETIENWRCSKCNETPKTMGYVGTADFMSEHFKFCNHCGAKMVEPQESEEI